MKEGRRFLHNGRPFVRTLLVFVSRFRECGIMLLYRIPRGPTAFIFSESGLKSLICWGPNAPLPSQTPGEKVGGFAPHLFPQVLGRQGAVWIRQHRRFQARLLKINVF
jgi:hypothetical protein